ncbi:allergen Asp f 7 homolog [Micropterus dolomieu]|uniref:allergen Asp f 7 homolog n=1 Tax=Micropterus dolomieu TaxID=147949 RepID=UPI001E8EDFB9|nr:allergen Asp f 7 homolog [Micropterus dolomieu]
MQAQLVIHTCASLTSIPDRRTSHLSASSRPVFLPRLSTPSSRDRRSSRLGPPTSASTFGQPGSPTCLLLSPPPRRPPVLPSLPAGPPATASFPPQPPAPLSPLT